MTYHSLNTKLGNRAQRKLCHNTVASRQPDGSIAIKYHTTNVLVFHPDGRVVFNTNGWRTSTTKTRLNRFGPSGIHVYQQAFQWFIVADGLTEEFYDGITFTCPTVTPLPA